LNIYSAVESTLLLICVHLPPSNTPADVSFVVADITQQGVDFNCAAPSVTSYLREFKALHTFRRTFVRRGFRSVAIFPSGCLEGSVRVSDIRGVILSNLLASERSIIEARVCAGVVVCVVVGHG